MSNMNVRLISTTSDGCITLVVEAKRVSYYIPLHIFRHVYLQANSMLERGWNNYCIAYLTLKAEEIRIDGKRPSERQDQMSTAIDAQKTPSLEYPYTLIATTAKSVHYRNDRSWFKTEDAARAHAQEIYDINKNETFELAVVNCVDVVKPKPRTEIISTWKKSSSA